MEGNGVVVRPVSADITTVNLMEYSLQGFQARGAIYNENE